MKDIKESKATKEVLNLQHKIYAYLAGVWASFVFCRLLTSSDSLRLILLNGEG